jgi:GDPmannose 4,6-dehydratase
MKTAFITGITGQDGSFLAELLLEKGCKVVGLVSNKFSIGENNIKSFKNKVILEEGDLLDKDSLKRIMLKHKPAEVYNLAGITFIPASWDKPELTFKINTLGPLNLLKIIKDSLPRSRFFQATSAKIFGYPSKAPQDEETKISPLSPYAVSKAAAHFLVQNFRDHFNLFACSAIMYNHESERRGPEFVTRKISLTAAKIKLGLEDELVLGNLEVGVDWGYAPDYVKAMFMMLQQDKPSDFILATGKIHTVRQVCETAFSYFDLDWKKYVKSDKKLLRKEEPARFYGDISKAKKVLGWEPETDFTGMIRKMAANDIKFLKGEKKDE